MRKWRVTGETLLEVFQKHILIGFKIEDLVKAERVFNFLPIITKTPGDEKILKTWIDFFTSKKVPFIVVEEDGKRALWKEELVSWRK